MKGRPTMGLDSLTVLRGGRRWSPGVPACASLTCVSREGCRVPRPQGKAVCPRAWLTEGAGRRPDVGLDGARCKRWRPPPPASPWAACGHPGKAPRGPGAAFPSQCTWVGSTGRGSHRPRRPRPAGGRERKERLWHGPAVAAGRAGIRVHRGFSRKTHVAVSHGGRGKGPLSGWCKEAGTDSPADWETGN